MQLDEQNQLVFTATDVANHLACAHLTSLQQRVARGEIARPHQHDPFLDMLRDRGLAHEKAYVSSLGDDIVDLGGEKRHEPAERATLAAMQRGVPVIVQAALSYGRFRGRPDVLVRVDLPSRAWPWSYEVQDTKLTENTRAGAILQLCLYWKALAFVQGESVSHFVIMTPRGEHRYRARDYLGYFDMVSERLTEATSTAVTTYPEPVAHCDICAWSQVCNDQRRRDDHLTFVARITAGQRRELVGHGIATLTALADTTEITFKPSHGSRESYERARAQAEIQKRGARSGALLHEHLTIEQDRGFHLLPQPSPWDVFLDFEGDPFALPHGREYLIGIVTHDDVYHGRWAITADAERSMFEQTMKWLAERIAAHPDMHVYHYAPYEPSAFKRLAQRYGSCQDELDKLLRGQRFIDLYAVVRQSIRASVESYSIKQIEKLAGFTRTTALDEAGKARRLLEFALETGRESAIAGRDKEAVERYNEDDCRATMVLRDWLELERAKAGVTLRPTLKPLDAAEDIQEQMSAVARLRERLGNEPSRALLGQLLDFHRREHNVKLWERYHRIDLYVAQDWEELIDDRFTIVGLTFVDKVGESSSKKRIPIHRYSYPPQDCDVADGDVVAIGVMKTGEDGVARTAKMKIGDVVAVDRIARTIDIKKTDASRDLHPHAVFAVDEIDASILAASLMRLGERVAQGATDVGAAWQLLERGAPRLEPRASNESSSSFAVRCATGLDVDVLPIQGPPGAGKTYTASHMIIALVKAGKRVGVTSNSHKAIRNLLSAVHANFPAGRIAHGGRDDEQPGITIIGESKAARAAMAAGDVDVLGGTAWLWSHGDAQGLVDVLFVDEAGQMALANVLAAAAAAKALVLLGDPQQLEQPTKASHPDGTAVSALEHLFGAARTVPEGRGIFLDTTYRLTQSICDFTSELFYDGQLSTKVPQQSLKECGPFDGGGLFAVPIHHTGNRNASDEEVHAVEKLVERLLRGIWVDHRGTSARLKKSDIMVIAPYNAQVSRLKARLSGFEIGTVDLFQGREAPVVIFSLATSSAADAPRGMDFLFSANRLNVATSRARAACIMVASPDLFVADCRTPEQLKLVNAFCRYRALAKTVVV